MTYFKERKGEDIIPIPTLEVSESTALTSDNTFVLVDGPIDDDPGFDSDEYASEYTYNGNDALISSANYMGFGGGNTFSYMVWVRPTTIGTQEEVFNWERNAVTNYQAWLKTEVGNAWYVRVLAQNTGFVKDGTFGTTIQDAWHCIVIVWDGTEALEADKLRAYINGIPQAITLDNNDVGMTYINSELRFFRVGGPNGGGKTFGGQVHSAAVWDTVLDVNDAAALYNGGNGANFDVQTDANGYDKSVDLTQWWRLGFNVADIGEATVDESTGASADLTLSHGTVDRVNLSPGSSGQVTLTLPPVSANSGKFYTITDKSGAAASLPILIATTGGDTISGFSSDSISIAKGSKTYYSDGINQWLIEGSTGTGGESAGNLQDAYDLGDGSVTTDSDSKPFDIAGHSTTISGAFSQSLTISGATVATGTAGGAGTITDINTTATGPSVSIVGTGNVTVDTSGNTITVSGTGKTGAGLPSFTHTQSSPSASWTVNHNLGTAVVNYIILDTGGSQVEPDTFTVNSVNQVTITFVSPQGGTAHIFSGPGGWDEGQISLLSQVFG